MTCDLIPSPATIDGDLEPHPLENFSKSCPFSSTTQCRAALQIGSAELALWPLEDFSSLQQPSWRTLHDKIIKLSGS